MDREGDIRVICNLRDNHDWMSTLLHELSHGVYFKYIDPGLPYLLREHAHLLTTEAVAMVMRNQIYGACWLTKIAGLNKARANASGGYRIGGIADGNLPTELASHSSRGRR
jgi:peptidyl-dipeptidase A